jgi:hypothetical protein
MDDSDPRPDQPDPYRTLLATLQGVTGWHPVSDDIAVDPAGLAEVRFHHPRVSGVLLFQLPDPVETALARGVLYQPFLGATGAGSRFHEALTAGYREVVEMYDAPDIRSLSTPPSVAVATVGTDRSRSEQRWTATILECIALDVEHLHSRLYETVVDRPGSTP